MDWIERNKQSLLLFLAFFLIFGLRIKSLTNPIWNIDESVSAVLGSSIVDGMIPYKNAIDHRGPVTYYIYAAIFALFGKNNMFAMHIFLGGWIACIAVILYKIARMFSDINVALVSILFFSVFSFTFSDYVNTLSAHTEWFLIFFSCLGVYFGLLARYKFRRHGAIFFTASGLSFGLAFFSKQPGAFDLLSLVLFTILIPDISRFNIKVNLKQIFVQGIYMFAGFVIVPLFFITWFYANDAFDDFILYFWTYNTEYYLYESPPIITRVLDTVLSFLEYGDTNILLLLCVLYGLGIVAGQYRRKMSEAETAQTNMLLFYYLWFAFSFIGSSLSGRGFGHYFIQTLPSMTLIAGISFCKMYVFLKNITAKIGHSQILRERVPIISMVLIFTVGSFIAVKPILVGANPVVVESQLIQYVHHNTGKNDKIFVWGMFPTIYVLTDRMPASRYTVCTFLTGLVCWVNIEDEDTDNLIVPGSMDILLAELKENSAKLFIDTSPGNHRHFGKYPVSKFGKLADFLKINYNLDKRIFDKNGKESFHIYKKREINQLDLDQ